MSGHTPGPWRLCRRVFDGNTEAFHIAGPEYGSGRPVCETPYFGASAAKNPEEQDANGRLIAAAPEMYEAIVAWLAAEETLEKDGGLRMEQEARAKMREAIQKAQRVC